MLRKTLVFALALALCVTCSAQGYNAYNLTVLSAPGTSVTVRENTIIAYHQLAWSKTGTVSTCTVAIDSSPDGTTWAAGGILTAQTCTTNGQSSIVNATANYIRVHATALSGGGSVQFVYKGWVNNPSSTGAVSSVFTRTGAVVAVSGDYTVGQVTGAAPLASPVLTGTPTVPTATTGDASTIAASTQFVGTAITNAIAAVNPAVATQAASAAVLPNSPTYNNGVSGIGATLTTATLNTALVVDGYTPVLNDRILVKNQASTFQNGVYTVTQVAGVGLAWILTRALDFDMPSDMNNTGAIPVINGTVNTATQWVISSTVNTVGTDAVTFTQFSINPSKVTQTIASGTAALATSAISSATCATVVTSAGTGIATTDVITVGFNGDPTGVTGYIPATAGMLTIIAYPTTNTANFKVCNNSSSSITPGAITLNWRVVR